MELGRMKRWVTRIGAERVLFVLAVASAAPMLRYLPTENNTARMTRERFDWAAARARTGTAEEGISAVSVFLTERPGSREEGAARMLLAELFHQRARSAGDRGGEFHKQAADQARLARNAGVSPAQAYGVRIRAVHFLIELGSVDRAVDILEELRREGGIAPPELLMLARLYMRVVPRRPALALERLDEFVARTADDRSAQMTGWMERAEVQSKLDRMADAVTSLEEALARFPDDPRVAEVRLAVARLLFRARRFGDVRTRLKTWAESEDPESLEGRLEARYWLARADLEEGRVQEAIERLRAILVSGPGSALRAATGVIVASAFRGLRELRSAYAYWDDIEPDLASLDFERPRLLEFAEMAEEARLIVELSDSRELLNFALRLSRGLASRFPPPDNGRFHGLRATSAERLSRRVREQAEVQSSNLRPEEIAALRERAHALRIEAAEAYWARSELREPSLTPGRPAFHAGENWHAAGEFLDAVRGFRRFLADCVYDDPMQPRALYLLGVSYLELGDVEKAVDAHRRNLWQFPDAFPDGYASRREMGRCYELQGDWRAAELAYLDVLNGQELSYVHPVWRESLGRLGEAYHQMYKTARAAGDVEAGEIALRRGIERLDEYRRRYPDGAQDLIPVLRTLGTLYLHVRKFGSAADAFRQAVDIGQGVGRPSEAFRLDAEFAPALREAALLLGDALFLNGDLAEAADRYADFRQRYSRGRTELWVLHQLEKCATRRGDAREAARYRELYGHSLQALSPTERGEGPPGFAYDFWASWLKDN